MRGYLMKILIAGAGSVGSVIGALLHPPHDVTLLRRQESPAVTIQVHGIENHQATLPVISSCVVQEEFDVVIFTTQAQQLHDIIPKVNLGASSVVVSLQNGISAYQCLRSQYPRNPIVTGCVWWSATLLGPTSVYYHRKAPTDLGVMDPKDLTVLDSIISLFATRFEVNRAEDIQTVLYRKLLLNVVSPVLALLKLPYPEGLADPITRQIVRGMFSEGVTLLNKKGVSLDDPRLHAFFRLLQSGPETSSMDHPHKVSTQISAEKHSGSGSNVRELLEPFERLATEFGDVIYWIPHIKELVLQLPSNYYPLTSKELAEKVPNYPIREIFLN